MSDPQPKPDPKPIKPGSLENKFFIMNRAPLDRRMKRKHLAVLGFILDWYHSKYGDALASVRHIVGELKERDIDGIGLYAGDIHTALTDLIAWGYIEQEKGTGRRASRYIPIWSARSVRKTPNTIDDGRSVLVSPNACVLVSPNATDVCVRESPNEDPSTPTRSQDPGTGEMDIDCATALPPLSVGLVAADAVVRKEENATGFDELWQAYGHRQKRADAKAAYSTLAPDADLHCTIIAAAVAWQAHWERQGNPDAPRKSLSSWIRSEGYLEDPPVTYRPKKAKSKPVPSNDNDVQEEGAPGFLRGWPMLWPAGRHVLQVIDSTVEEDGIDAAAFFTFRILSGKLRGKKIVHRIYTKSCVPRVEEEGKATMLQLINACDLSRLEDSAELHGLLCAGQLIDGEIDYERLRDDEFEEYVNEEYDNEEAA